jgi:hypothetical protein
MLDRTNAVYEATPDAAGGYTLQPQVRSAQRAPGLVTKIVLLIGVALALSYG